MSDELHLNRSDRGDATWDTVRWELAAVVFAVLHVSDHPPTCERLSSEAFMRLAGLTSFSDWIASSLPFGSLGDDLCAYYQQTLARAQVALDQLGWGRRDPLVPRVASFEDTFAYLGDLRADMSPVEARPLQAAVVQLMQSVTCPTLLVIEAPMGEGKTEAAFYAHLCVQVGLQHRGLYIALPTQATGNMMFMRTREFLDAVMHRGPDVPPRHLDLQLLHGASLLNDAFQAIRVRGNVREAETDTVTAQEWFSHKKRGLLSEYGVGTVDQALLAILNVKHQFVRLWGLANRTVVLDEVHAYDTYTSGLIQTLVRWLHALGSSVIVMSATLPATKRDGLLEAFGGRPTSPVSYPRITKVAAGRTEAVSFEARWQPPLTVRPMSSNLPEIARHLTALGREGGCIVCIVNTVDRAQRVYHLLEDSGLPRVIFHARYPAWRRQQIEAHVVSLFGRDGRQRPERAILVATQVVEQSLDLDFDVMLTDLAPIDLLLQRAGRLHRHTRPPERRRAHSVPVLYVAGMEHAGDLPELGAPGYFDAVYERYVLLRTWAVLKQRTRVDLPQDIDRLVQLVYGEDDVLQDAPDVVRTAMAEARAEFDRAMDADQDDAWAVVIGHPDDGTWETPAGIKRREDDDPGYHVPVLTRKGRPSVTAVPLYPTPDGFALDEAGTLPIQWSGPLSILDARTVYMHAVSLSRPDIVRQLRTRSIPAWEKSALLRDCRPLIIDGEHNVFDGRVIVRYDPTLGIVYDARTD